MAPGSDAVPNFSLQGHRRRLDLTQEQVAEELVRLAWEHHGVRVGADGQMVSKWERGEKRPSRLYRQLLCLLYCATQEQLGFRQPAAIMEVGGHDGLGQLSDALEDDLNRRDLIRNAATLGAAVLAPFDWLGQPAPKPTSESREIAAVRDALMRYDSLESRSHVQGRPAGLPVLRRRVDRAWAAFQSSRYSMLGSQVPHLLPQPSGQ
jgi:transcriptional regulator with XRE-family HTH domain